MIDDETVPRGERAPNHKLRVTDHPNCFVGFPTEACHTYVRPLAPFAMPPILSETQITTIYRDTVDALYAYASRRCGGQRQLAEDITQETWLRAVREWRRAGVPDNPLAWLTTVARNLILNQFRRHEPVPIDALPPDIVLAAVERDDFGDSAEIASLVNGALARIPPHEARLLEAFHFERCRVVQLATLYGISERAIEGRLRRARERLRHELVSILPHHEQKEAEGGIP